MARQQRSPLRQQGGMSLLISLVMLVVLTLLVTSAVRMSNSQARIVGNMQAQNEAVAAAQQAIEKIASNASNFYTPAAQTFSIDVNGDGVADFTVQTSPPVCLNMAPVPGYSVDFAASAPKDTYWDVKSVATDNRTGASVTIHQGIRVRLSANATC